MRIKDNNSISLDHIEKVNIDEVKLIINLIIL